MARVGEMGSTWRRRSWELHWDVVDVYGIYKVSIVTVEICLGDHQQTPTVGDTTYREAIDVSLQAIHDGSSDGLSIWFASSYS